MDIDYNEKDWATPCPKYDCRKAACKCGLKYVNIPTSLGDDSANSNVAPSNGAYCNALVVYEANNHVYIYSKEGVPTLIDVDASDISTLEQEVIKAQKDVHELRADIDRFAYFFDTVADMRASTQLHAGDYARTLGYYNKNDGGSSLYKIEGTLPSRYHMPLSNGLYATLIAKDVNVSQLGAVPYNENTLRTYFNTLQEAQAVYPNATSLDDLVCGVAIQCAIRYFHDYKISFDAGRYNVNTDLNTGTFNRIHLVGDQKWKCIIKRTDVNTSETANSILDLNTSSRCVIENIDFVGPYEATDTSEATLASYNTHGIKMTGSSYNTIKNCVFRQCSYGIITNNSWTNIFEDCYFARCDYGVHLGGSEQNVTEINHCFAEYCNYGFYMGQGRSQLMLNCNIEKNNICGLVKTNSGDLQVISCYFEDNMEIRWGQQYAQNALVCGCSFYQSSSNKAFYTPIVYHGADNGRSQFTIMNCNFIDNNADADIDNDYAVKQLNNYATVAPTLINNNVVGMTEFEGLYMRGVHINNGLIDSYKNRAFATNNINASDGGTKTLDLTNLQTFRINLSSSGTYTIKVPSVPSQNRWINHRYEFLVPSNNPSNYTGVVNLVPYDSSECRVDGHTAIDINDKNKMITLSYAGYFNSKDNWTATISA